MKLVSARVKNYRLHRDLSVEFDPARTLIGGRNETGKSTLIEAIHRGLFLKSTVTGESRKSMVSNFFPGNPEVEVRFTARGSEYRVTKRFSGASGTTTLVEAGGQTWHGEEAEARLASLLGVEEPRGGRGILDRVSEQWSHLWVWQGKSGDDPAKHAASQQANLLQRLQETGGAVAMQSELDGRVASRFAQAKEEIFTQAGRPRSGSDLDRAQKEVEKAREEHDRAQERLGRLLQAVADFETAVTNIRTVGGDLERLGKQRKDNEEKLKRVEELRQTEKDQTGALNAAIERVRRLEGAERRIAELRQSRAKIQESVEPRKKKREELERGLAELLRDIDVAGQRYENAQNKTREVRLRRDLATACVSRFEREARLQELDARLGRVRQLEGEIEDLRQELAKLPAVDKKRLESLRRKDRKLDKALAALEAMAAEIEVVEADQPVWIGESELPAGGRQTVVEPAELRVGDSVRLRIHPGGGNALADARETVRKLRTDIQRALDEHGLGSVEEASQVAARRTELESQVDSKQSALDELEPEDLAEEAERAREDATSAQAEVERRAQQVPGVELPTALSDAQAWLDREEKQLEAAERSEAECKAAFEALQSKRGEFEDELSRLRESIQKEEHALTEIRGQLKMLIAEYGDDEARLKELEKARKQNSEAEGDLARTQEALEALQPGLLEADRERLERACREAERKLRDAEDARIRSETALRLDGTDDPNAGLSRAQARLKAATEHLDTVERRAKATELIDSLFQQEQRALADRFSQPLAEKITVYLQCLFGPDARAVVRFEDNAFSGIELVRSAQGGAMSFEALSGGAREQVAAAVRLAIAELLAAEHDGSLPIVFDDAFAYSDPERVNTLQRMLDLGASRGLQVIVLTSNPSDYTALGAHQVTLNAQPFREGPGEITAPDEGAGIASVSQGSSAAEDAETAQVGDRDCEEFVAALSASGGRSGNHSLRRKLGWDEAKYQAVKDRLIAENRVVPGRGRGGSVSLADADSS